MAREPHRGALAYCSLGHIGLITSSKPEPVYYEDGSMGLAWKGKHIWPFEKFGDPWSSGEPEVFATIHDRMHGAAGIFEYLPMED